MADKPAEHGDQPAAAPRARRPRAAKPEAAPSKPRARRAVPKPTEESAPEKVKRVARSGVEGAQRTAARAEKAVAKATRTARSKVEDAARPAAARRVAIGTAAAVGVVAGVAAAVLGRRTIARTAGNVAETVSGKVAELKHGHDAPEGRLGSD